MKCNKRLKAHKFFWIATQWVKWRWRIYHSKIWPVWSRKEGNRENYKQFPEEGFRNVELVRSTEEFTRPTAVVL